MTRIDAFLPADDLSISASVPEGWLWTKVTELGESNGEAVKTGPFGAILKSKEFVSSGIPVLAVGNVQSGRLDLTNARLDHVTETKAAELSAYRVRTGDVLFTRSGTIGRSAVVAEWADGWLMSYHLLRVRPDQRKINPRYLYLVFTGCKTSLQYTSDSTIGTTRPGINTQILENVPVPLPPRAEQDRLVTRIDDLSSRVSSARNHLSKIPTILKSFRQAVLAAALSGRLTEDWRSDRALGSGSDFLRLLLDEKKRHWERDQDSVNGNTTIKQKRTRDYRLPEEPVTDDLASIPESWAWVSPDQLSNPEDYYSLAIGPFGSNLKVSDYTSEGVPLIFVRNIRSGIFEESRTKYISQTKAQELRPHWVESGDILVTKMGDPPGDATLYPPEHPIAVITADCVKLRTSALLPDPRFVVHAINSPQVRSQILKITMGVAQMKISLERFKTVAIPLPPPLEQIEILRRINYLFRFAEIIERRVELATTQARQLTESIIARALRGELVPTEAELSRLEGRDYEPASVLLERIRAEKVNQGESPPVLKRRLRKASAYV